MDFANDDEGGFAAFYDRLVLKMMAGGPAYKKALQETYDSSRDYCDAIMQAYEKDGFSLGPDLSEPDERIQFEMWDFFSKQKYDVAMLGLLQLFPEIMFNVMDQSFWYNQECVQAAEHILDALVKVAPTPDPARTIGEVLGAPPYPLKEPPEFCARFDSDARDESFGKRPVQATAPMKRRGVA